MTLLVDRLRGNAMDGSLMWEAADEIERLRAALRKIADYEQGQVFSAGFAPDDAEAMQEIARAALANEQHAPSYNKDVTAEQIAEIERKVAPEFEGGDWRTVESESGEQ